jgi:D-tyrosyl-tRNA(Tyr) deacylase
MAEELYEYILEKSKEHVPDVQRGEFGAHMKIDLENDGPFTVILDSAELLRK